MMSGQVSAETGHWYHSQVNKNHFEVVDVDYDAQSIEVQYFDGETENIGFSGWKTLIPTEIPAPEDWSGPYEIKASDPAFDDYAINEALNKVSNH